MATTWRLSSRLSTRVVACVACPWWREVRPISDEQQYRQVSGSLNHQIEEFAGGWVHPMRVFENRKNWMFARHRGDLRHYSFQYLLPVALRAEIRWRVPVASGHR